MMFNKVVVVLFVVGSLVLVAIGVGAKLNIDLETSSVDNTLQPLRGIITHVEPGTDGVQIKLETEDGIFSVTIGGTQAEIFGRYEAIKVGGKIEVSGQVIGGMEPTLIVAEHVKVLGSEDEYVMNLLGTVKQIEVGTDGITAVIEATNQNIYHATISSVTSEILYIGGEEEIKEETVLLVSGELLELDGTYIVADMVVVNPILS